MDTQTDPYQGKLIRGYRLEQLIERGPALAVYRARTEELWQVPELIITIFLLPERLSPQVKQQFETRFLSQARQISLLRHPFLFPLYGYGIQEGTHYLISPTIEAETLLDYIQTQKRITPANALAIIAPVASMLSYIHQQGLTYQFLQTSNILLTGQNNVQVGGLGLPQMLAMQGLHHLHDTATFEHLKDYTGAFLGAPEYLAPEVVKGSAIDARSDVYSLGCILFEMLSGQRSFTGGNYSEIARKHIREPFPSLHEITPDLPVALELIINRAVHRSPERRFQTPDEFIDSYTHVLEERLNGPRYFGIAQSAEKLRPLAFPAAVPKQIDSESGMVPEIDHSWSDQVTAPQVAYTAKAEEKVDVESKPPLAQQPQSVSGMIQELHQIRERLMNRSKQHNLSAPTTLMGDQEVSDDQM